MNTSDSSNPYNIYPQNAMTKELQLQEQDLSVQFSRTSHLQAKYGVQGVIRQFLFLQKRKPMNSGHVL